MWKKENLWWTKKVVYFTSQSHAVFHAVDQMKCLFQLGLSGDGKDKGLRLKWQFYLYPSLLGNFVPIHPACPESPRLKVSSNQNLQENLINLLHQQVELGEASEPAKQDWEQNDPEEEVSYDQADEHLSQETSVILSHMRATCEKPKYLYWVYKKAFRTHWVKKSRDLTQGEMAIKKLLQFSNLDP